MRGFFLSMAFALKFYGGIPHSAMDTRRHMEDRKEDLALLELELLYSPEHTALLVQGA